MAKRRSEGGLKPDINALKRADRDGLYIEALEDYPYMMTVEDAAVFLRQTRQAITHYLREGKLGGVKSGREWRIPKRLLIEFLYQNDNSGMRGHGRESDCEGECHAGL